MLIRRFERTAKPSNFCIPKGGADLAITYTSQDCTTLASDLSKEFKVQIKAFKCDVSKSAEVDQLVEDVERVFEKKVDIGVANAGELGSRKWLRKQGWIQDGARG